MSILNVQMNYSTLKDVSSMSEGFLSHDKPVPNRHKRKLQNDNSGSNEKESESVDNSFTPRSISDVLADSLAKRPIQPSLRQHDKEANRLSNGSIGQDTKTIGQDIETIGGSNDDVLIRFRWDQPVNPQLITHTVDDGFDDGLDSLDENDQTILHIIRQASKSSITLLDQLAAALNSY